MKDKNWSARTTGSRRDENTLVSQLDGYNTPRIAVEYLFKQFPELTYTAFSKKLNREVERTFRLPDIWWEPANGFNRISRPLRKMSGIPVFRSDVHRWSKYTDKIFDFTYIHKRPARFADRRMGIVTNPPFKHGQAFVESGLSTLKNGEMLALLLRTQFLEGRKRKIMYGNNPPTCVLVFSFRLPRMQRFYYKGPKSASILSFSWFIWIKGSTNKPYIVWL